jgi:hypothetical protein
MLPPRQDADQVSSARQGQRVPGTGKDSSEQGLLRPGLSGFITRLPAAGHPGMPGQSSRGRPDPEGLSAGEISGRCPWRRLTDRGAA